MIPRRPLPEPSVIIEDRTVRKRGKVDILQREIEAMEFVRSKTSLPVPQILATQLNPDDSYKDRWILMERCPGLELGDAWDRLSDQAKENTTSQLKTYLAELHSLRPASPGWIGSCSHDPAYDHRIDNMRTRGPWESVATFHDFLVKPILECPFPDKAAEFRPLLPDQCGLHFAHADLHWDNILVDPDTGDVTAVLDWEMAGYWPEWWEFRKAVCRGPRWWFHLVLNIMQQYRVPYEADMDIEMF